ncbi:MAG: type I methionyl aminopeptidase [Patescibacteria group bacterium UBA2163]
MSVITNPEDLAYMRESGRRLGRVVDAVARMIAPGVSVADLNKKADELIRATGDTPAFLNYKPWGADRPFPASICISVNEEVVHGIPNENPHVIEEGDIVSLDCGLTHHGLISDHAVSVVAGTADAETQRLLDATREGMMAGINAARAGNRVGDISAAIEAIGVKYGYGIVQSLGGHGVGYRVHEEPYIPNVGDAGTGPELIAGMVLAIEPMFTEGTDEVDLLDDGYTYVTTDGSRNAHFEHTILVTDGEPEILTRLQ